MYVPILRSGHNSHQSFQVRYYTGLLHLNLTLIDERHAESRATIRDGNILEAFSTWSQWRQDFIFDQINIIRELTDDDFNLPDLVLILESTVGEFDWDYAQLYETQTTREKDLARLNIVTKSGQLGAFFNGIQPDPLHLKTPLF